MCEFVLAVIKEKRMFLELVGDMVRALLLQEKLGDDMFDWPQGNRMGTAPARGCVSDGEATEILICGEQRNKIAINACLAILKMGIEMAY